MSIASYLVASLTPYFLKKRLFWFEKNFEKIRQLAKSQPWWQRNCLFLGKGKSFLFSSLVQKLLDLGYERVQEITFPGEFSQRGGLIDVFPINSPIALRLEFFGNIVEEIQEISFKIPDEKRVRQVLEDKLKSQKLFSGLKGLLPGDYVVHLDHGVARFIGISYLVSGSWYRENEVPDTKYKIQDTPLRQSSGGQAKYYILEYASQDRLYVPLGLERKLSRYVGFVEPKISRLGSQAWQKTKRKIKQEVERFAKELLQIYAQREIASRPPYSKDKELELILEAGFPFQETADQIRALAEIEKDLGRSKPMDRLLCGDVGFGKTEVALRAMLIAVSAGWQAAFLCPTTILANQHFQNFKQRLKNLPVGLAVLTRLQTKKEQKETVEKLKSGRVDILVGTHRLLSKDVSSCLFGKGGGLLVIDDEQRFGVRQKEKLKKIRASLDILSLSATPIPRTLYLALSSLREMSLIQTPPKDRLPIKTFIIPWSEKTVKKAVDNEISRGGQVYYLHNRVATIEKARASLEKLLPRVKIGLAHGRMKEKALLKVMADFQSKEIDLLLATTIIENGIDFPNVNTLIVEDASRLGLAQAYQIRGRVGRFSSQAFAYFLHPQRLLMKAKQRLTALKQAETLGSGWQIAIKDLEIRGAGNILGKEQSGSINQVGLNLYCQMLSETVARQKT
ncbi:MAG: CarD family transcriptional regulator [bacterium]|nr:CarD family transcriptional regulator [bacterium]